MFVQDFILNGQGHGEVGEVLSDVRFDPGLMRPFFDERGNRCVTVNTGRKRIKKNAQGEVVTNQAGIPVYEPVYENRLIGELVANGVISPVFNATTLRKEEWIMMDDAVLRAARQRLRAWSDLAAANTYSVPGMSTMILEHETMSDPGEAVVDMDGLAEGRTDNPLYQLEGLPLPITHSDFWFSQRRLAVGRKRGTPLETTMAEAAGRRVAEMVERTTIGAVTGVTYGGGAATPTYGRASTVFGYTNFTNRNTYTSVTAPTTGGWVPATTINEVLAMRDLLTADNFYGPFMLYYSNDWDQYMDRDYVLTGGNVATQTLRQRLKAIEDISDVRRLDFLTHAANPYNLLLVQMTQDVARAVNGMDITTVQWESQGGMRVNFKVMCIMVPQLRADYNGNCGICHGTTS
jgi:hypothetical protein